jgi:hypothetical protein
MTSNNALLPVLHEISDWVMNIRSLKATHSPLFGSQDALALPQSGGGDEGDATQRYAQHIQEVMHALVGGGGTDDHSPASHAYAQSNHLKGVFQRVNAQLPTTEFQAFGREAFTATKLAEHDIQTHMDTMVAAKASQDDAGFRQSLTNYKKAHVAYYNNLEQALAQTQQFIARSLA